MTKAISQRISVALFSLNLFGCLSFKKKNIRIILMVLRHTLECLMCIFSTALVILGFNLLGVVSLASGDPFQSPFAFERLKTTVAVPPEMYDLYYKNLDLASLRWTAALTISDDQRFLGMSPFGVNALSPASFNAAIVTSLQLPSPHNNSVDGSDTLRGRQLCSVNTSSSHMQYLLKEAFVPSSMLEPEKGSLYNFSLVIIPPDNSKSRSAFFCADCLLDAIEAFNRQRGCTSDSNGQSTFPTGCVTSVFYLEEEAVRCDEKALTNLQHDALHPYSFIAQPVSSKSNADWEGLLFAAFFNRDTWQYLGADPLYMMEWHKALPYVIQAPAVSPFQVGVVPANRSFSTCSATSTPTVGIWTPYGGWTLWGRVVLQAPSFASKRKLTQQLRHVVMLVPSTTVSVTGSTGRLVGADAVASGLAAALTVVDEVRRKYLEVQDRIDLQLDLFALPAEWVSAVGSTSLFQQVVEPDISSNWTTSLPFDIHSADLVIAMEQLALQRSDAPLFYHVDQRANVSTNEEMKKTIAALCKYRGVYPATTAELKSSPITGYIDFFPQSSKKAALLTIARYDQALLNPHVFTPSDVASSELSSNAVAEAADVVLRLILENASLSVNRERVQQFWYCLTENLNCSLVDTTGVGFIAPNFAASGFTPHLSEAESGVARLMEVVGLKVHPLPALPPEFAPLSRNVDCWKWKGVNATYSKPVQVLGEVLFASGGGARLAMVSASQTTGWVIFLFSILCCVVVSYFTWKIVM